MTSLPSMVVKWKFSNSYNTEWHTPHINTLYTSLICWCQHFYDYLRHHWLAFYWQYFQIYLFEINFPYLQAINFTLHGTSLLLVSLMGWCQTSNMSLSGPVLTQKSMVSCQKGPTCHTNAWQIGPFWQDTLEIFCTDPRQSQFQAAARHKRPLLLTVISEICIRIKAWINEYIKQWDVITHPDSKAHGANMGPIWGRQDPGGPHVGPMNFALWASKH